MRDYILLIVILATLPFCFKRPFFGLLVYVWISLMNPHRFTWGIAYSFPVAKVVALATIAGLPFIPNRWKIPREWEAWILAALGIYFSFTTFYALAPEKAWADWSQFIKIYLMIFIAFLLIQTPQQLRSFFMTIAISIGLVGLKGGLFALLTGGGHLVYGPPESFIADNNALALAEIMVLPLLLYLGLGEVRRWLKIFLYIMASLLVISIVSSYSRGALLGLSAIAFYFILISRHRWRYLLVIGVLVIGVLSFIPQKWFERMGTIAEYQDDASVMGRINAWWFAYNLALDRPLVGGGFRTFQDDLFLTYAPDPYDVHDAHSIYFEVLGEHGFVGLGLFLSLMFIAFRSLGQIQKWTNDIESLKWANQYSRMLKLSIIAYCICGAFLGLAYFDLYYYIITGVIVMKVIVKKILEETSPQTPLPSGSLSKRGRVF